MATLDLGQKKGFLNEWNQFCLKSTKICSFLNLNINGFYKFKFIVKKTVQKRGHPSKTDPISKSIKKPKTNKYISLSAFHGHPTASGQNNRKFIRSGPQSRWKIDERKSIFHYSAHLSKRNDAKLQALRQAKLTAANMKHSKSIIPSLWQCEKLLFGRKRGKGQDWGFLCVP